MFNLCHSNTNILLAQSLLISHEFHITLRREYDGHSKMFYPFNV